MYEEERLALGPGCPGLRYTVTITAWWAGSGVESLPPSPVSLVEWYTADEVHAEGSVSIPIASKGEDILPGTY